MPIYEYACPDCGHKFDEIQKFSDPAITVCPKCAQANVKKLISQTSFILKGGGWYKDHYGLKPGGTEGSSGGASGGTSGDGSKSSSGDSASTAKADAPAAAAPAAPSTPASSGTTSSGT